MLFWFVLIFCAFCALAYVAILYFFTRSIWKTALINFLTWIILLSILAFFVFRDIQDLQQNLVDSPKMLLIKEGNDVLVSAEIHSLDFSSLDELPSSVSASDLIKFSDFLLSENYGAILRDNYRIFIFDIGMFDQLPYDLDLSSKNSPVRSFDLNRDSALELLRSDDPLGILISKKFGVISDAVPQIVLDKFRLQLPDPGYLKVMIFSALFSKSVEKNGPFFLLYEFKKNNLMIYPESITFRIAKLIPDFLIREIESRFEQKDSSISSSEKSVRSY